MIEVTGNLWTYKADIRVITTNGTVKKNGEGVMGRGCAFEATQKYPNIAKVLGFNLRAHGNHVTLLHEGLYSFPVKHNWYEKADIMLIRRSADELVEILKDLSGSVVLPRPGCGNGGLQWEDVKEVISPVLDDRFHVITF